MTRQEIQEFGENRTKTVCPGVGLHRIECCLSPLTFALISAQGQDVIPIPEAKKKKYLEENAASADVQLSKKVLDRLNSLSQKYPDVVDQYSKAPLDR